MKKKRNKQPKLTSKEEAFFAGFKPIPSVQKGGFVVITQKDHPFQGDVAEFMGEGMKLKEEYFDKGKVMGLFKLVRGDAMDGHECYVDAGGARMATKSEIRIARGY